ncbi:ABC transporter permease subunit [Streptomyces sp. NPDC101158]|uniref:ABC transporter permease subunit n=1 Tax=Streptomyces sp. NPDC101158 TaxID=3366117 RepID=UPI0038004FDA
MTGFLPEFRRGLPRLGEGLLVTVEATLLGAASTLVVAYAPGLLSRSRHLAVRGGVRNAVAAVPRTQTEASVALGMGPGQHHPSQAHAPMVAPFKNLPVRLSKATPLLSLLKGRSCVMWDGDAAWPRYPSCWRASGSPWWRTLLGFGVAAVLGLVLALVARAGPRWVAAPVNGTAAFVRSTPLLVQLFAACVLLPGLEARALGVLVLGVHYATYLSEVYRTGIEGVPRGHWEACTALSLPRRRVCRPG